jgi:hypothetical protein
LYYDRRVSETLLTELSQGGALRFLVECARASTVVDLQLRATPKSTSCRATLYVGLTKVLDVHEQGSQFRFSAYTKARHTAGFRPEWAAWVQRDALVSLAPAVRRYAEGAIGAVADRYLNQEGRVQGALCSDLFEGFAVFDREAVVGYSTTDERKQVTSELFKPYAERIKSIDLPSRPKSLGTKADVMALDPEGRVLVIEVKPGRELTAIAWSPVQVAFYKALFATWRDAAGAIASRPVEGMLEQRLRLGLVRASYPVSPAFQLVPVVAIGTPLHRLARGRLDRALAGLVSDPRTNPGPFELWEIDLTGPPTLRREIIDTR